ncbi:MAG: hypothetical protein Q7Q71_12215 [Verrucomicrobiota bacterium JB023]|nr:hypothetical protein [Verrucomicrobiota bacterium JB023]
MKNRIIFAIWLALFGVALGQDEEGSGEVRGRKAWFLTVGIPEGLENPVNVLAGGKLQQVVLSKRSMSAPVKIPADGVIQMVKSVENPDKPGEVTYIPFAQAKISESVKEAMLIFAPTGKKVGEGMVFNCKVFDLNDFRGGDFLYMNLSPKKVAVTLGDEKLNLSPGEIEVFEARNLQKSKNVPTSYHFYMEEKERWQILSASTVVLRPTRREICIFSWDTRFNRINYHGVTFPVAVES